MADFKEAFGLTGHTEAGYSNNPSDHGGETFAGIARKFWPNWKGWVMIDQYKMVHNGVIGINNLLNSPDMQVYISQFYKQNFWDVNKLDLINDQQLANNVYDFGVNSGVTEAAKALQETLGVPVDGIIGNGTLSAANSGNKEATYNAYNQVRIEFYNKLAQSPGQLQFLKGWMSRIKPYQA